MPLPHFVARVLIGAWLQTSPDSWKKRLIADDSPHIHAPGTNPDRVLLVGDGVATGRGVLTHELGLPGYLARSLSRLTGHATDVDIYVHQEMTVESSIAAIDGVKLARFDTIVLSIGHNEALSLMTPDRWRDGLEHLLEHLARTAPATVPISILAIPVFGPKTKMPGFLAAVIDAHVPTLNAVTAKAIAGRGNVTLIKGAAGQFEPETAHLYKRWADHVASSINTELHADRVPAGDSASMNEMERQLALEELEASETNADQLDDLVASARHLLGTPIAAITFIHSDYLIQRSAQGIESMPIPRAETFCDTTIRRASHLVIEDTTADPRYSEFPVVTGEPGVRFYAGYPIESPDGHRVGAFCVMDTETRKFTQEDMGMLRTMAHLAEERLWPAA